MEESIKPITEEEEEFKPIEVQTPPTQIQPNQEIIKEFHRILKNATKLTLSFFIFIGYPLLL